ESEVNVGSMIARWGDQNRMIICEGSGYSAEFSPSGEKLAEFIHPAPVAEDPNPWLTREPSEFNSTLVFDNGQGIDFTPEGAIGVGTKEDAFDSDRYLIYMIRTDDDTVVAKNEKQFQEPNGSVPGNSN
ncbi:hypothetical protein ACFL2H_05160, partial [Planctomycetota bacterium]